MSFVRSMLLKASESQWLAQNLPRMAFSRHAVRRFMPGEELEDALSVSRQLAAEGIGTVITRLGENITALAEAHAVRDHYVDAAKDIRRGALPTHLSVKLTQLGLDISAQEAVTHVRAVAAASAEMGAPVWIDMESSRYTETTLDVFRRTRAQHENVGLCVQAYLHRTPKDIAELLESTTAIRLVKGAYKEPAGVALQSKKQVDASYLACALQLLAAAQRKTVGYVPAFATHDTRLIEEIITRARQLGVPRENFEFQMLYGIQTAQQKRLASEGFRLRVLISYGSAWFAWYMRRLAERPANVWFVVKSVVKP
jgi:proline dehydrogenase